MCCEGDCRLDIVVVEVEVAVEEGELCFIQSCLPGTQVFAQLDLFSSFNISFKVLRFGIPVRVKPGIKIDIYIYAAV